MITGAHAIVYGRDAEADRKFMARVPPVRRPPISRQPWGVLTNISLPGGGKLGVYQPRHKRPRVHAGKKPGS
jgi:hypothetical protein